MSECSLPERELKAVEHGQPGIMLDRDVAWAWAGATGRADLIDGDLRPVDDIDTVGEAIVAISNSEQQREDFSLVYRTIARANGAAVLSERLLARMVEAANDMFIDTPPSNEAQIAV